MFGAPPRGAAPMPDNTADRGPQDRSRISLEQDYEVRYWSQRFGIDEDALRSAVEDGGPSVDEVERYLASREGLHCRGHGTAIMGPWMAGPRAGAPFPAASTGATRARSRRNC